MSEWLFEKDVIDNHTPSRKEGIDKATERRYRREGAKFIFELGKKSNLGYVTVATGIVFFHRFYMKYSFKLFPRYTMASACLYLAGKVEESPKKAKDVIKWARQLLSKALFAQFGEYPEETLHVYESILCQTIKFDFVVQHPYEHLKKYIKCIKAPKDQIHALLQRAWIYINDSLRTTLCLQWEPEIMAIAALYLAGKILKFEVKDWEGRRSSHQHWWDMFVRDLYISDIEEIGHDILDYYDEESASDGTSYEKEELSPLQISHSTTAFPVVKDRLPKNAPSPSTPIKRGSKSNLSSSGSSLQANHLCSSSLERKTPSPPLPKSSHSVIPPPPPPTSPPPPEKEQKTQETTSHVSIGKAGLHNLPLPSDGVPKSASFPPTTTTTSQSFPAGQQQPVFVYVQPQMYYQMATPIVPAQPIVQSHGNPPQNATASPQVINPLSLPPPPLNSGVPPPSLPQPTTLPTASSLDNPSHQIQPKPSAPPSDLETTCISSYHNGKPPLPPMERNFFNTPPPTHFLNSAHDGKPIPSSASHFNGQHLPPPPLNEKHSYNDPDSFFSQEDHMPNQLPPPGSSTYSFQGKSHFQTTSSSSYFERPRATNQHYQNDYPPSSTYSSHAPNYHATSDFDGPSHKNFAYSDDSSFQGQNTYVSKETSHNPRPYSTHSQSAHPRNAPYSHPKSYSPYPHPGSNMRPPPPSRYPSPHQSMDEFSRSSSSNYGTAYRAPRGSANYQARSYYPSNQRF